ncbi:MAG: hypothetical protein ACTS7E_03345 [Arsenophonus sp. NC-CH8-MAG3]
MCWRFTYKRCPLKVKAKLQEVWLVESRDAIDKAINVLLQKFSTSTKAMKKLEKDRE